MLAVFTLFMSPGPNMAFVLPHGMAHGPGGGIAAALGIASVDPVLTVLTTTGFTAGVAAWPPSFDLLRYLDAIDLLWLAILGVTLSLAGLFANAVLAMFSGKVSNWFAGKPRATRVQGWGLGTVLFTLALRLLLLGRPAAR